MKNKVHDTLSLVKSKNPQTHITSVDITVAFLSASRRWVACLQHEEHGVYTFFSNTKDGAYGLACAGAKHLYPRARANMVCS